MVKNPPANVGDVGFIPGSGGDPLEKEMATHPSFLAWRIPRTEEPPGYSHWGRRRVERDLVTTISNQINNEPTGEVMESYVSVLGLTDTG